MNFEYYKDEFGGYVIIENGVERRAQSEEIKKIRRYEENKRKKAEAVPARIVMVDEPKFLLTQRSY